VKSFYDFLQRSEVIHPDLRRLLLSEEEASRALMTVQERFLAFKGCNLPFSIEYNADASLAKLIFALTRVLRPNHVVETGVGYGISSAVALMALERNESGLLISIDMPPFSDPEGKFVGLAVPERLRHRWKIYRGSSRRWLPRLVKEIDQFQLFISDSANVYTLQRFEFSQVWPRLAVGGAVLVNNCSFRFNRFLEALPDAEVHMIRQEEKVDCVTALVLKCQ
jgi:hypothetical protein